MPRALHPDTRPQRADDAHGADPRAVAQRYEPSDAPPRGVAKALWFAWLLLVGGAIFASATVQLSGGVRRAAVAPALAPAPHLLADPAAERREIEAKQRDRRGPAREAAARRKLIANGWPADGRAAKEPVP